MTAVDEKIKHKMSNAQIDLNFVIRATRHYTALLALKGQLRNTREELSVTDGVEMFDEIGKMIEKVEGMIDACRMRLYDAEEIVLKQMVPEYVESTHESETEQLND